MPCLPAFLPARLPAFLQIFRAAMLLLGSIRASRLLARQLLDKVVRLPMSFFDSQPTGGWVAG